MDSGSRGTFQFEVDGRPVAVADDGASLLEVLRDRLGLRGAKDGCSPQGQCGCCTVLVDGTPRVACVTPARRVAGRRVTTIDGLPEAERRRWAEAFCATGASQCGFCTPGIVVRLAALRSGGTAAGDTEAVVRALLAHLCRCTGWRSIVEAWDAVGTVTDGMAGREGAAAARRATIEGRAPQRVAAEVALGQGGFADDTAPDDALVAVPRPEGGFAVAPTLAAARAEARRVQGRRSTLAVTPPLDVPPGEWDLVLRTSWVEPAYLEPDASWCRPGGEPASPLANGGAFGGKVASPAPAAARALADELGSPVRVVLAREDVVRLGPKRPPIAAGVRRDGSGVVRVVRTPGVAAVIRSVLPGVTVEEVDVAGPPVSLAVRGAGWVEATVLRAVLAHRDRPGEPVVVTSPDGAMAGAEVTPDGVQVSVRCGAPLDDVVLRSYCVGAAHQALGWVTSEGLAVDEAGEIHSLTIRSFGILRAVDMPDVRVTVEPDDGEPVNGSDAVFAAVAAAAWIAEGLPPTWPTGGRHT